MNNSELSNRLKFYIKSNHKTQAIRSSNTSYEMDMSPIQKVSYFLKLIFFVITCRKGILKVLILSIDKNLTMRFLYL